MLIVVPARYASSRFPGKPLAMLRGPGGVAKPLIQWSWEAACRAADVAEVVVATDDMAIAAAVTAFGGVVRMTSTQARNGTERCAEVVAAMAEPPELVINLQGDSPLIRRGDIVALIAALRATNASVATPFLTCDAATRLRLLGDRARASVGGTSVVTDMRGRALYFSKQPVPIPDDPATPIKLHIGLYGYRPAALADYARLAPTPLEQTEGLEQLRFLEHAIPIQLVEVPPAPRGFWEVNNPEDVRLVEEALAYIGDSELSEALGGKS